MQYYTNKKKIYEVESVELFGAIINVNGTSITDLNQMYNLTGDKLLYAGGGYTVFCDSDELYFDTFDKAYEFAMTKQKDTFSLDN